MGSQNTANVKSMRIRDPPPSFPTLNENLYCLIHLFWAVCHRVLLLCGHSQTHFYMSCYSFLKISIWRKRSSWELKLQHTVTIHHFCRCLQRIIRPPGDGEAEASLCFLNATHTSILLISLSDFLSCCPNNQPFPQTPLSIMDWKYWYLIHCPPQSSDFWNSS